jgi:nucleic acid binding OB-fold tRNA/helicase-type
MKLNVLKNTAIAFISLCTVMSCVKDDDYELPDNKKVLPAFAGKVVSFSDVASRTTPTIKTYSADEAIEGYVISSDEGGNFYKKIYIQNEDKTQALSVALDKSGIYTEFPIGAKVQLRLKGLTTQLNNAITEVGYKIYKNEKSGRESVGSIAEAIYKTHLYDMGGERKTLASLAKEVTSIETVKNDAHVGQLITLKGVHFPAGVVGKTMYDDKNKVGTGTNYKLTDANGKSIDFRTSSFAKFKDEKVPSGTLDITGVISKFNTSWQFMISNYADIKVVSSATTTSTQTSTQTATTVVSLEASTATVADYVVGKNVKLHGTIITKAGRAYFKLSDNTLIQIAPETDLQLTDAAIEKLGTQGYELTATGKFENFTPKKGDPIKEIKISKEADLVFGTAPAKTYANLEEINASTESLASVYQEGKLVKLHGKISVKNKKSYITFSDGGEVQLFSPIYSTLSKEVQNKLGTEGQQVTILGKFEDYVGKDNTITHELIYVSAKHISFEGTTPQPTIKEIDAANATVAEFTNNIGKKVKLIGTITEKSNKSYIKLSDGTEIQLFISGYGKLDKSFRDKMKQGAKIAIIGEFGEYGKDKIKQLTYKAISDVEFK